jgi:hypothetical protein
MASLTARHLDLALAGHRSKNIADGYQSAYGRRSWRSHHEEDGSKSLPALARTALAAS